MKTEFIQFRVNAADKKDFLNYCKELKDDKGASEVLLEYVKQCAREYRTKKQ